MAKPFHLLRHVFWLLAVIMLLEVLATILAGVLCWWTNMVTVRAPGACMTLNETIREVWQELLTGILALLVAGKRNEPPDDEDGPDDEAGNV